MTQMNLGNALWKLGERESETARMMEAVAAWDACLEVTASVWLPDWVRIVKIQRDEAQTELRRRSCHPRDVA